MIEGQTDPVNTVAKSTSTPGVAHERRGGDSASDPTSTELKQKTARGVAVSVVGQGASVFLRIVSMVVLARLLPPEDFGLQGMVVVVTAFLSLFRDAGLSLATVQQAAITHEQTSTLFWINVGIGVVLAGGLSALAPVLAAFYKEPRLQQVAMVSALAFIFNGFAVQHQALLQRRMRFVALAIIEVTALLTSTLVGITMAAFDYGYWALVGMSLTLPLVTAFGAWIAVPWIPGRPKHGCGILPMLRIGGTWTFIGLIVYISYNVEKMLLGRFWGAESLGLYGRAYQLINLPTELLNASFGKVALSALSRLQHDAERLRRNFLKCYSLVISVTIPVTFTCALYAEEIIWVILGPKWSEATLLLQALAPTVFAFALMNPFSWFLMATSRNRLSIGIALIIPPAVILGILAGLPHGPSGVALGYSAGVSLVVLPVITLCCRAAGITMRMIWDVVRQPLFAGLTATLCGLGLRIILKDALSPVLNLLVGLCITWGGYAAILLIVLGQKAFYMEILKTIFQGTQRKKANS